MGRVYQGEHVTLRKKVAIKVLKQEFCHDRTNVERFLQEARAASMIRHENIVDIMDFGQVPGGSVFFVMELLEGSDISDMLKQAKRLPWLRSRNILLQVVRALRAAHESGIIHRDMKPGNVFLINRSSATDYVKVLDFGIAKVDDAATGLTRTGAVFGTAGYMAPEQACGDPVDGRTDVYAVGCMMFEMLTGKTPFPGTNFMRVLTQHLNEPPPLPRDVSPEADISDEVETIILTALAKKPDDRFPDMAAFEKAIAQANGEVATVPPQNRPRTDKGTLVLEDVGVNPFAGMTPGQPPPGYIQGGGGGPGPGSGHGGGYADAQEGAGATMMLDGPAGAHGGEAPENATMMLDGMGGFSLGSGAPEGATMMLEGLPEGFHNPGDSAGGVAQPLIKQPGTDKNKLYKIIGAGGIVFALIVTLALVFGGKDKDEGNDKVADASTKSDTATDAGELVAIPDSNDSNTIAAETGGPTEAAETSGVPEPSEAADDGGDDGDLVIDEPPPPPPPLPNTEPTPVGTSPKTTSTQPATVKDSLSAADINRGITRLKSKISACKSKGGLPGMKVKVNFMIADGKVKTASPRPPHNSTPVGKCVADVVKAAKFTKAKQTQIVDHEFTL